MTDLSGAVNRVCEHVFVRWSALRLDVDAARPTLPGTLDDAVVRRFDAPEALDTRFHEVRARSALNRVPAGSRMPFRWTVNPYRGCTHACVYCFARPTHTYLGFDAGRDFDREIVVKVNVPELVRAELARPSWAREHVALGTNTDPYQWVEGRYRLTRDVLAALGASRTPCSVLTKSPLVLRDLDLLAPMAADGRFSANLSVPTLDERAWRATEPRTANPRARLEAIAALNAAGVPCGILVAPLMPGINDDPRQVEAILDAATAAGAVSVGGIALYLRGETRGVFLDWLRTARPDLVDRYEELYARSAHVPEIEQRRVAGLLHRPGGPPPSRFDEAARAARAERARPADPPPQIALF